MILEANVYLLVRQPPIHHLKLSFVCYPHFVLKTVKPFKLPKVETDQLAIVDRMDQGPQVCEGASEGWSY